MTYESIVEAARNKFYDIDVSSVPGTLALISRANPLMVFSI